jgi:hypothetical protein
MLAPDRSLRSRSAPLSVPQPLANLNWDVQVAANMNNDNELSPFPPVHLVDSDKVALAELADTLMDSIIEDYENHLDCKHGVVNAAHWVRVKQIEDVVVYQDRQALKERRMSRIHPSRGTSKRSEMVNLLWAGTLQGELDDIMHGVVTRTADEARVKAAYLENNVLDCAVFTTLAHPTADDPFRSLQLKWAVNAGPVMMRSVVRSRDFVYLESTGVTTTSTGERLGFQLLHSITLAAAPELHEHKFVRGDITLCHFFRQKREASREGVVDTYVKAFIDLKGDMPLRVATTLSTSGVVSVWKLGEFALMKKLQWKLSQRRAIMPSDLSPLCGVCMAIIRGGMVRRRTCKICVRQCCARCCVPKKMFFARGRAVVHSAASVCKNCLDEATHLNGMDIALDELSKAGKAAVYSATASPRSSTCSMMV